MPRGRGAVSNASGRYEFARAAKRSTTAGTSGTIEAQPLRTTLTAEKARVIITRNDSPDVGFDRSINPYRGLRARLHLLLRPARPRLHGPVARPRFREQAVLQARARASCWSGS